MPIKTCFLKKRRRRNALAQISSSLTEQGKSTLFNMKSVALLTLFFVTFGATLPVGKDRINTKSRVQTAHYICALEVVHFLAKVSVHVTQSTQ